MFSKDSGRMRSRIGGGRHVNYVGTYTLLFAVFFFSCCLIYNLIFSVNMFTYGDGLMQQYPYFLYSGKWLRRLFSNLFVKHVFEIPSWDMTLYGFDPLIACGTLILDPFYFISAFVPVKYGEIAFDAVITFKYWLSGLSFLYFCRYRKHEGICIIAGSLIYVFSGIAFIGLFQANFINLFYLFPFLMAGVLKLWEEKKFVHYVLALGACTLYDYYFTFVMGLLVIIYCVVRFAFENDRSLKKLGDLLLRFIPFTLLGIALAIGPSLPGIINMSRQDRLSLTRPFELFYIWNRSKAVITGLFSFADLRFESHMGISAAVIPGIWCLFASKKKRTDLKLILILYYVSFFFPVVGSMFNGGNYANHRYIFGFAFLVSYLFVMTFRELNTITSRGWKILFILCGLYIIPCLFADELYGLTSAISVVISVFMIMAVVTSKKIPDDKKEISLLLPVFISCLFIGATYGILRTGVLSVELGDANYNLTVSDGKDLIKALPDMKDRRYDRLVTSYGSLNSNASMIADINGYDFYHSNYDQNVCDYIDGIGLISDSVAISYRNLHGRNFAEIENGTSYITVQDDVSINVPYSYHQEESYGHSGGYSVYVPDIDTSIAYFYDDSLSYDVWDSLDPVSREESMMYSVFTEDGADKPAGDLITEEITYEITEMSGIIPDENGLEASEDDAFMVLNFDEISDCEVFLVLEEFDLRTQTDHNTTFVPVSFELTGTDGSILSHETFNSTTANVGVYHPKPYLVFNTNPFEGSADRIKIIFGKKDSYDLRSIKIYVRHIADIEESVERFADHADTGDVSFMIDGDHLYMETSRNDAGILYLAVPYSEGWRAYVDGKETEIKRANVAFMAIDISGGEHHIEFVYHTPYLKEGAVLSIAAASIFIITAVIGKKRYNTCDKKVQGEKTDV
ncbi:MAG: YfhO family protein [Clostridiales bacterium]|nr:YfhO family protein [Clostridiales bacterium]